ncbi:MAG TPA: ATP-binding cassette domain-containing protein [Planctomycetaceae bacterium]|nr:ATP-binding cassette domain-containing protein [Planctomycetaceae bacterium]
MSDIVWRLTDVTLMGGPRPRLAVTLAIPSGLTAVLGESGAGKTSLLNLLVGFERPTSGQISGPLAAASGARGPEKKASPSGHLHVFWSPPDHGLWPHLTVRQHLAAVSDPDAPSDRVTDEGRLADFDLLAVADAYPATLSQGERVRLATARALASAADVLVLDEPFANLDGVHRGQTAEVIRRHMLAQSCKHGTQDIGTRAIVFSTHQPELALRLADHVVCLEQGRVLATGSPRELAAAPPSRAVAELLGAVRLLALLLVMCLIGCGSGEDQLPTKSAIAWSLPQSGMQLPAPRAVTAGPDGTIYALDNVGRVLAFNPLGEPTKQWWMPEYSVGRPERILVCRDGRLAIADTHYHRIVLFDAEGNLQGMFGARGEGPGQFIYPVAIAEDDRHNLYVCEYGGHDRVQVFRPDGEYVAEFGSFGVGPGQFQRPSGIVWRDGRLYIADAFNNRIFVCNERGEPAALAAGAFAADLHYPYDIAASPTGEFAVVEYGAGRVTKFSADGVLRGRYVGEGQPIGPIRTPWGLGVDPEGRVLVADTGNRRLVRIEFAE